MRRGMMGAMRYRPLLIALWVALAPPLAVAVGGGDGLAVTLHVSDPAGLVEDCAATTTVERTLAIAPDAPLADRLDAALRALFAGPTDAERAAGLDDPYAQLFMEPEPLPAYYLGVTVSDGLAVVDFAEPGFSYLNSEACRQAVLKGPIVRTLLAFDGVTEVAFAIEGEVVTEWGA